MRKAHLSIFLCSLLMAAGCSKPAGSASSAATSPEAFLKWSMDEMAKAPSFTAKATVGTQSNGKDSPGKQEREISILGGKRFRVISTAPNGFVQTAVSDGSKLVEYASGDTDAKMYPASGSVAAAPGMYMHHPMFCGSLLYAFFGGSANYGQLVAPDKGQVTFGGTEPTPGGENGKVVKFYATGSFGRTEALIGENTGRVYRIVYDSEPLLTRIRDLAQKELEQMPQGPERKELEKQMAEKLPKSYVTTESYRDISTDSKIAEATFNTEPKGIRVVDAMAASNPAPLPLEKPAPAFTVRSVGEGKTVSLASLKGKVVMIDFWATWCGPCKEGLPETEKLEKESRGKNFAVLAVSGEEPKKIAQFMQDNKFSLTAYHDPNLNAMKAYGVDPIPCVVIIDAQGKLRSYLIGLQSPETLREELRKAGAKI